MHKVKRDFYVGLAKGVNKKNITHRRVQGFLCIWIRKTAQAFNMDGKTLKFLSIPLQFSLGSYEIIYETFSNILRNKLQMRNVLKEKNVGRHLKPSRWRMMMDSGWWRESMKQSYQPIPRDNLYLLSFAKKNSI